MKTKVTRATKSATTIGNSETSTVADDLRDAIAPTFAVKALLQGALALISDPGVYNDPNGEVWAAREIIEAAMLKVEEVYFMVDDLKVYERIHALEGGAA